MARRKLTETANHFGGVLATARWQTDNLFEISRREVSMMSTLSVLAGFASHRRHNASLGSRSRAPSRLALLRLEAGADRAAWVGSQQHKA